MRCDICFKQHGIQKPMLPGKALLPVWGNYKNNHMRGATIYPIAGVVGPVLKCTECGHSVSFTGRVMGYLPERRAARLYIDRTLH